MGGNDASFRSWVRLALMSLPYSGRPPALPVAYGAMFNLFQPYHDGGLPPESKIGFGRPFLHGLRMMMPFADRIAMRALILFTVTFTLGGLLSLTVLSVRLFTETAIPGWATSTILAMLLLSFISLGNFITLFAVFSQSMSISLSGIDRNPDGSA